MSVADIPAWCADYVGIPYKTGGRERSGIDCWGLFNLVWAEHFSRPLPDYEGALWRKGAAAAEVAASANAYSARFSRVAPGAERCGDGILFRMRGQPLHLALVVAPGWMLHVEDDTDSCVEEYRSFRWERRIIDFYRYD